MTIGRTIAALMIAPVFWLGIGTTEHVRAAAERAARGETQRGPLPPVKARYAVDPDGIRWLKSVGAAVTTYLVDRNQAYQQVLEDRVAGAVTATYVYLDDLVAAGFPGSGTRFYHYDGQMSTRQLTDSAGAVSDEYTFDAFGVTLAATGSTPNNYLYTGEQFDPNIGMQYNRARYLNLTIGRFISHDPFLGNTDDPISLHRYLYANVDPVRLIDPSGLSLIELIGVLAIRLTLLSMRLAPLIGSITAVSCLSFLLTALTFAILSSIEIQPSEAASVATAVLGLACTLGLVLIATIPTAPSKPAREGPPASAPVGRSGSPIHVPRGTNTPAVINNRPYSGHALDEMQSDGIVPSAVDNAIANGATSPGKVLGSNIHYDAVNNISVVTHPRSGVVITVSRGQLSSKP